MTHNCVNKYLICYIVLFSLYLQNIYFSDIQIKVSDVEVDPADAKTLIVAGESLSLMCQMKADSKFVDREIEWFYDTDKKVCKIPNSHFLGRQKVNFKFSQGTLNEYDQE